MEYEIIFGIGKDEKKHSIFVGFIFVVLMYRTVPDTHHNYSLVKITIIPKNKYHFFFVEI